MSPFSIQVGTVTLALALTDIEPYEAPMDEVDDNALTLVPRARFSETTGFPVYDAKNSITLRMPVLDLKRITYASIEEMVSVAWV